MFIAKGTTDPAIDSLTRVITLFANIVSGLVANLSTDRLWVDKFANFPCHGSDPRTKVYLDTWVPRYLGQTKI